MFFKKASRAAPLAALSATEMLVPFIRMFILTHLLGPYEFGFSAALSAAYATIEQITDTGLYRFVTSAPRERYKMALATAHGLSIIRGVAVAAVFIAIAYPTSCTMVSCGDWPSFVWLAPLTFIKGFENLELRVYERDYRYWPQLVASIGSHSFGLVAMLLVGFETDDHRALIAYMIVQSLVFVALTHFLAKSRFRFVLRGPMTREVLHFSIPLMANGTGLAILGQGDRLIVGAMLGVETLGLYAVLILTAYVPTSGLFRLMSPIFFAGLINSAADRNLYATRLRLYSRAVPTLAAIYALGWIVLGRTFIPAIFGSRFVVSELEILLVGLLVFFRICRLEPASSLLLQTHNTRRMALVNQLPIFGLGIAALLTWWHPTLETLLVGTSFGEFMATAAMLIGARKFWGAAWQDAVCWCGGMVFFPAIVGISFVVINGTGDPQIFMRVAIGLGCAALIGIIASLAILGLIRKSYGKGASSGPILDAGSGNAVATGSAT